MCSTSVWTTPAATLVNPSTQTILAKETIVDRPFRACDGDAGGDPTSFTYTAAEAEQYDFVDMITAMGLAHDTITFEGPMAGTLSMEMVTCLPVRGPLRRRCQYLSCLCCQWRHGKGTAEGKVDYTSAANTVIFELYNNGHAATPPDEPGIGDMDGTNDTDRGINTTQVVITS